VRNTDAHDPGVPTAVNLVEQLNWAAPHNIGMCGYPEPQRISSLGLVGAGQRHTRTDSGRLLTGPGRGVDVAPPRPVRNLRDERNEYLLLPGHSLTQDVSSLS
jgi:hypothetical protein